MNKKRKSPTEIIESRKNPHLEEIWIKAPREELKNITLKQDERTAEFDGDVLKNYDLAGKKYSLIHPHAKRSPFLEEPGMPSKTDLRGFLRNNSRTMIIAQQDKEGGKVSGYTVIRKTRKTRKIPPPPREEKEDLVEYEERSLKSGIFRYLKYKIGIKQDITQPLKKFAEKYHLQYKFVPTKGYYFDQGTTLFRPKSSQLESRVAASIITITLITLIFLFVNNMTGFSISSEITKGKANLSLIILFILALAFVFIKSKKRRKTKFR